MNDVERLTLEVATHKARADAAEKQRDDALRRLESYEQDDKGDRE